MVTYGTHVTGTTRDVGQSETARPGVVYEVNYTVSGLRVLMPGWESDAINEVSQEIQSKGGQVVYIGISGSNVVVQWRYNTTARSANAHAMVPVLLLYAVAAAIVIILGIWLIVTITSSVKEISNVVTESPQAAVMVYGMLALGGLIVYMLIQRQRSSG